MTSWLQAQGWLLYKTTIAQDTEFTLSSNYAGPRNQLDQITVVIEGGGWEWPDIQWHTGTVSTRLPPVRRGQWQCRVNAQGPCTWLCLDQRYNPGTALPELRCQVLEPGDTVSQQGLYYLARGQLQAHEGSFKLSAGERIEAVSQSVILIFSRARDE